MDFYILNKKEIKMPNITNINGDEKYLNTYSDDNFIYSSVNLDISVCRLGFNPTEKSIKG